MNLKAKMAFPNKINLQWHITDKCNLRCKHCYQESFENEELDFKALLHILDEYKNLLALIPESDETRKGHIIVTGGEPFLHKDFFKLLDQFKQDSNLYTFTILTNGTTINLKSAKVLKEYNPAFVQLSLEGGEKTHDFIRGKGDFARTCEAVKALVQAKVKTYISFTAHKLNFREFPIVAEAGRELNVDRVWSDRLIPLGNGIELESLTHNEVKEYFKIMLKAKIDSRFKRCKTEIAMHRALQFLSGGTPYFCKAGNSLLSVLSNGNLVPCRRMPVVVGNLFRQNLIDLYQNSGLFNKLRENEKNIEGCADCQHLDNCKGGLKCLSYIQNQNPFTKDPGCYYKK